MGGGRGRRRSENTTEDKMAHVLDDLEAYARFKREVAPKLRAMVERGASTEEIYKFAQSYAAARAVSIALMDRDTGKALGAVKEILDRSQGKAKERIETEHRFSKVPDKELDAILESRLKELADEDEQKSQGH